MSPTLGRSAALFVTGLAVLAALLQAPMTAAAPAQEDERPDRAKAALAAVEELLAGPGAPHGHRHRGHGHGGRHDHHDGHSLTMALRDLALAQEHLTGDDRETAERILARPDDGSGPSWEPTYDEKCGGLLEPECPDVLRTCSSRVCVHYVTSGPHATDPAYAVATRKAATRSLARFEQWGYRPPLPDAGKGGDDRPDVYLVDLPQTIYGYAVAEGYWSTGGPYAYFGYAVTDKDFVDQCALVYPHHPCGEKKRRQLMRVTLAHELFHVVQFGYDVTEDAWMMEATATWMEDEVFTDVNDNVNFLHARPSKLQTPAWPLDHPDANWYGNWIFFRYLSERFGRGIVRQIWQQADAWKGHSGDRNPPDLHSVRAVRNVVHQRSGNWSREYARFHERNRRARSFYSEGREQNYPVAPLRGNYKLTRANKRKVRTFNLHHLGGSTHRIRPGNLRRNWDLRITVDGMDRGYGYAIVTIRRTDGTTRRVTMPLGSNGRKTRQVAFGADRVRWVEVTIVNASIRYRCWEGDRFDGNDTRTCKGTPRDDGVEQRLVTRAVRP